MFRTKRFLSVYFSVGALRKLTCESFFFQLDNRTSVSLDNGNRISCQVTEIALRSFKSHAECPCSRPIQILALITKVLPIWVSVKKLATAGQSSAKPFTIQVVTMYWIMEINLHFTSSVLCHYQIMQSIQWVKKAIQIKALILINFLSMCSR